MRHSLFPILVLIVVAIVAPAARASGAPDGDIGEARLPGGIETARALLRDRTSPSRAFFLVDFIRRFYDTPRDTPQNQQPLWQATLARLEEASRTAGAAAESVPLPFTPAWWTANVFAGKGGADTVVLDILRSRDAALLYCGLMALDPETRAWLGGQPALVRRLARGDAALLVVAAPGVRVVDGRFLVPGGEPLRAAWESLVGAATSNPGVFLQRVLADDAGVLAYFLGRTGHVPDRDLQAVLETTADGSDSLARLYRVFARAAQGWTITGRPFSSMPDDPALLLLDLCAWRASGVAVPGDERFWSAVFEAVGDPTDVKAEPALRDSTRGVDLAWLLDRAVRPSSVETRLRFAQVRFAGTVFGSRTASSWHDRAATLVALGPYPALVRTLERARIDDAAVYRAAIARAQSLRAIGDPAAQARATAQFQGALALATRVAARRGLGPEAVSDLIVSLSAVPVDEGEYGDGIARWLDERFRLGAAPAAHGQSEVDADFSRVLVAYPAAPTPTVEWEGTRYRIDLAHADRHRLERVRGERNPAFLSCAWTFFEAARRLDHGPLTSQAASKEADLLDAAARAVGDGDEDGGTRDPLVTEALRALGAAARGRARNPRDAATAVRRAGEAMVARGLAELAYAAALGGSGRLPVTSFEASWRHDFDIVRPGHPRGAVAWRLPVPAVRTRGPWHLEGSLLALDVCLADTWLRRTSERPLSVPPSIDRADRLTMSEVVVTLDPLALDDSSRDRIARAIAAGRARFAALASADDVEAAVSSLPLDGTVRTLLPWIFTHEREHMGSVLSPLALMRLGERDAVAARALDVWGASVRPRQGCICLEFPRYAPDRYMGYSHSGVLMGAVPDLNLRLAEWLHTLKMPAALLPGLLAGATMALVDQAPFRYPDDLRAIIERIDRVTLDEAEQYLAMLTTDGPLVPVGDNVAPDVSDGGRR